MTFGMFAYSGCHGNSSSIRMVARRANQQHLASAVRHVSHSSVLFTSTRAARTDLCVRACMRARIYLFLTLADLSMT